MKSSFFYSIIRCLVLIGSFLFLCNYASNGQVININGNTCVGNISTAYYSGSATVNSWTGSGCTVSGSGNAAQVTWTAPGTAYVYANTSAGQVTYQAYVTASKTPSVTFTSSPASPCAGDQVTFTASPVNAGNNPSYDWYVDGVYKGNSSSNKWYYSNFTSGQHSVYCQMYPSSEACVTQSNVLSPTNNITIGTPVPLSVTISGPDVICPGTSSVVYSASVSPLNASPSYSWVKNGNISVIPDAGDPSKITLSGLQTGNSIRCDVTSNVGCVAKSSSSNTINITAITTQETLTIGVSPSKTQLCAGESVTFTASPSRTVTGNYKWYEGGVEQTAFKGNTYTTTAVSATQLKSITTTASASTTCLGTITSSGDASAYSFTVTPGATAPTAIGGPTTPCTGTKPAFNTTSYNATDYTWTVTPSTAGTFTKTISGNTSTGTLTLNASFGATTAQTATVNVSATGCSGAVAGTPLTITVKPNVTTPAAPTGDGGRCIGSGSTNFSTTGGGNADSYKWTILNALTSTISGTSTTGQVLWDQNFAGTATIQVQAVGCGGTSTAAPLLYTVRPNVSGASFNSPIPSRCAGAGQTQFTANANNATSITYSMTPAAGTINASTGLVTWNAGFTGTATITAVATGCGNPSSTSTDVVVTPVTTPTVTIAPSATTICINAPTTFVATPSTNATSPTYVWKQNGVVVGGNSNSYSSSTINANMPVVCTITTSASCLTTNTASATVNMTVKPNVTTPNVPTSDGGRCIGDPGTTSFAATGGNADSYQWSFLSTPGTSTIGGTGTTGATGVVTWDPAYSGTATILVKSVGCGGTSTAAQALYTVSPKVSGATIVSPITSVCASGPATQYNANANNASNGYAWSLSPTSPVSAGTIDQLTGLVTWNSAFSGTAIVSVKAKGCGNSESVAPSVNVTVNAPTTPTVGVSTATTNICINAPTTFVATPSPNATSPTYVWKQNGVVVGGNSNTYSSSTINANMPVVCTITTSATCLTTNTALATVNMTVKPNVTAPNAPTALDTGRCVGSGTTGFQTSGGGTTTYEWQLAGSVGTSTIAGNTANATVTWDPTYTGNAIVQVRSVGCNAPTAFVPIASAYHVSPNVSNADITGGPLSRCAAGDSTTYTATATNASKGYTWNVTPSTAGSMDANTGVMIWNASYAGNATVTVTAKGCGTSNSVDNATVVVTANSVPTINITANQTSPICFGTGATFSIASQTNQGTAPTYQWQVNGSNVSTANSYTTSALAAGTNTIKCLLTSNLTCVTGNPATSNTVTLSVTQTVGTPSTPAGTSPVDLTTVTSTTYSTSASNATGYNWTMTPSTAGTITPAGGVVTWDPSYGGGTVNVSVYATGCNGPSSTVTKAVTVYGKLSAGVLSPAAITINYNSSPGTLSGSDPSGSTGIYTYTWQVGTDGINFSDIASTDSKTYTVGNLAATKYYRRKVTCGSQSLYTNAIKVTVLPPLVEGVVSPASASIAYNNSVSLSSTDASGGGGVGSYDYTWQVSSNGTSFTSLIGAKSLSYRTSQLIASTYYRVRYISNNDTVYSMPAFVEVIQPLCGGTIAVNNPVINSGGSITLSGVQAASNGGCAGNYTYQWQSSADEYN